MQQKLNNTTINYGPDFNLIRTIQGKFYSILDEIKSTGDPGFIAHCLGECQKILSMGSDITGKDAMQTPAFSAPDASMITASTTTPSNPVQSSARIAKKRKHSEIIDLTTDIGTGEAATQHPSVEPGISSTKRHKPANPHLKKKRTQEEKEIGQAITLDGAMSKRGKVERKLISPFLNKYIQQMAQCDPKEYEKVQRDMIQKNGHYNNQLSMRHISSIGQRSDFKKEIKPSSPDRLRNKFIYSHHINFPFTVKKNNHSLQRLPSYQNEISRREFISKEIIPNIRTAPSLAAQNLIYLYQHHLMYSIYLQRKSGGQLGEILIYHMNKSGFNLDKTDIKSLKLAINWSYDLIKQRKPFNKIVKRLPMVPVESPTEKPQERMSDGAGIAAIVLYDNPIREIKVNDTFDEPFPKSIKIVQDTDFYNAKGKLIGLYRTGIIQPNIITDKLRKELSSITQKQLNRMGAISSEESSKKRQNKEKVHINNRLAPFGVLGRKLSRIRPTRFSEAKFGIEEGLAPLFETAEKIYAESAPIEYAARCRAMDYASCFTLSGSRYLLTAAANYDKQTNAHVVRHKFPVRGLNPMFVIYPSKNGYQRDVKRTYEGAYTFFPGVCGTPNDDQSYFEGIYFDLKEGDVLLWDCDRYFYCHTKLIPTNGVTDSSWHRISIDGFTNGDALNKIVAPLVFEDSDDEDSALFQSEESAHSVQLSAESLLALSQSRSIKDFAPDEIEEHDDLYIDEEDAFEELELTNLNVLLSSGNAPQPDLLHLQSFLLDSSTASTEAQNQEESRPSTSYATSNSANLTFFRSEKPLRDEEVQSAPMLLNNIRPD